MFHTVKRALVFVLVVQTLTAAIPVQARQERSEQWTRVERLDPGSSILIAVRGQAQTKRTLVAVFDDAVVLKAPDRATERVARADIDRILLPPRGSQPAAVAMGFLGFFFGFAAAATSAPSKGAAAAIIVGTPIAFGMAGYHGLKRGEKLIYERGGRL